MLAESTSEGEQSSPGFMKGTRVTAILRAFALVLAFSSTCAAYGDLAHRNIVRDAFEFIIANKADAATRYVDGSTPKSDYDVLLRVLAIKPGTGADGALRAVARQLADGSVETDRFSDVTLTAPGIFWGSTERTEVAGYYFTLFSHFLNVRSPATFWKDDGYSYKWAQQNPQCSGGVADALGNFLIEHSNATVNTVKSTPPFLSYRQPLKTGITITDYERHFRQQLRDIAFWPITALARHWFTEFVGSSKDSTGAPLNLLHIAPVLHAAADTTSPFHAVGMSGCGHVAYEDMVDGLYQQPQGVYDRLQVQALLTKIAHLDRRISMVDLLTRNAEYAADKRFCTCTLKSCNCSLALNNPGSAKELANLAIAATVLTLRKGFTEWAPGSSPASGLPVRNDQKGRVVRVGSLAEVNVAPPLSAPPDGGTPNPVGDRLAGSLTDLKQAAAEIERLSASAFTARLNNAIAAVIDAAASSTERWDPFELRVVLQANGGRAAAPPPPIIVLNPRVSFGLPTAAQLERGDLRAEYLNAHHNFHIAYNIYRMGVVIGALEGHLKAGRVATNEQTSTDQYTKALRKGQDALIQAFRRGTS